MPGTGRTDPGPDRSGVGLRALAELINDVLAGWGTRPALPLGPQPVFAVTTGAGAPAHPARTGRGPAPARRPSPTRRPAPSRPAEASAPNPDGPEVEDEHAEVWELVARAQAGDGEAFGKLYDRYVDVVFRFVYFRVNDRALAEDFTSETFLRALRRIGGITYQGRDIGAWFVTIARNIVLDHMKSARHRLEVSTADTLERDDHEPGPENAVIDALTAQRLLAAVDRLGDEQRECVLLRFIQGLSVSETAEVMGKNDGAVKALQHRAIRKLAELVGDELR
ncbi:MAG: sigma-70 family RNA polymerase sigma factor [Jatrophihabitans sp.]|nr:MAG: sigma-70 family RNA polymerase sigma factor [Jatrophihabitans sp.]